MPTAQQIQIETLRGWLETKPELIPGCAEIVRQARIALEQWDAIHSGQTEVGPPIDKDYR